MATWIILAGVLVVLMILGGAVLAVMFATRDKKSADDSPAPAAQSPGLELGGGTSLDRPSD